VLRAEDWRLLVKRRPFKPFRITMATNEVFDVPHPNMLIVGRSIAALGLGNAGPQEAIAGNIIWLGFEEVNS
jgi:hypothetical protein